MRNYRAPGHKSEAAYLEKAEKECSMNAGCTAIPTGWWDHDPWERPATKEPKDLLSGCEPKEPDHYRSGPFWCDQDLAEMAKTPGNDYDRFLNLGNRCSTPAWRRRKKAEEQEDYEAGR